MGSEQRETNLWDPLSQSKNEKQEIKQKHKNLCGKPQWEKKTTEMKEFYYIQKNTTN